MRTKSLRTSSAWQPLNPRLDKMIATYATTASAVGVALLAAAQPAEAKVVYTQARVSIGGGVDGRYNLDLNHDGIVDFSIGFCSCQPYGTEVTINSGNVGNMVIRLPGVGFSYSAAALKSGAPIGPKQLFRSAYQDGGLQLGAAIGAESGKINSYGPWPGMTGRYLGLKFMINGEAHYGWARMTVGKQLNHVVLTGYAYETIANKPIKAGQTSEAVAEAVELPSTFNDLAHGPSLGMLAYGARAMDIWKKKEELS